MEALTHTAVARVAEARGMHDATRPADPHLYSEVPRPFRRREDLAQSGREDLWP